MCMIYIQIGLLIVSLIAAGLAILSYLRIHRHRVIYSIKRYGLRLPSFEPSYPESETEKKIREIDKELVSGRYTIIQIVPRNEYEVEVYLGQVKQ